MPRFALQNITYSIRSSGADGAIALSVANAANLNPTAGIGLSIFIHPTGTPKAFIVWDKSQSGATNSYFVSVGADGSPNWFSIIATIVRNLATSAKSKRVRWGQDNLLELGYWDGKVEIFLNGEKLTEEITGLSGALGVTTEILRILSYYTGALGINMQGYSYRPRIYSRLPNLAEHRHLWFNRHRDGDLERNYLLLDLATVDGSGTTVTDKSGFGSNATMGAIASWNSTVTLSKLRGASTTRSLLTRKRVPAGFRTFRNQFLEYIPTFTALQTTTNWINGSATGSATDKRSGWSTSGLDGSVEAGFDTTEAEPSLYMATTAVASRITLHSALTTTGEGIKDLIEIKPSTAYICKFKMRTEYTSGDSDSGAFVAFVERTSAGAQAAVNASSAVKIDSEWTEYTVPFTSGATSRYLSIRPSVTGNTGAATLIMKAWLKDFSVFSQTHLRNLIV